MKFWSSEEDKHFWDSQKAENLPEGNIFNLERRRTVLSGLKGWGILWAYPEVDIFLEDEKKNPRF